MSIEQMTGMILSARVKKCTYLVARENMVSCSQKQVLWDSWSTLDQFSRRNNRWVSLSSSKELYPFHAMSEESQFRFRNVFQRRIFALENSHRFTSLDFTENHKGIKPRDVLRSEGKQLDDREDSCELFIADHISFSLCSFLIQNHLPWISF